MPTFEIVTVGTEILLGDVVDSNAAEIARSLRGAGIDVRRKTTVGDNVGRVRDALREALARADGVVVTGGLGPTVDDVTREAVAEAIGAPLVFRPELWEQVRGAFERIGRQPTDNNRRQAYLPEGASAIPNPVGTAPGILAECPEGLIVVLPGVPSEMRHLLESDVVPYLRRHSGVDGAIVVRVVRTSGVGESAIDARLADLEVMANPTVGLAAHPGRVDVRVTAKASSPAAAEGMIAPVLQEVRDRLGPWVYGLDEQTLEGAALDAVAKRGWCLVAVECGMGGALVGPLAAVPGPFRRGEVLQTPMSPDHLARQLGAYRARHGADVGLGAALLPVAEAHEVQLVVLLAEGAHQAHHTIGGAPALAPARAASMGLDLLLRRTRDAGPPRG